ncbi:hypothetical protein LENED_000108 [Lentinula edodes]|uniref:Uncharacterized protein n=1 Tax=Lentinula edodes TaxID=5353 RepID=A0A1Q3DUR6_LENED|nr:hypothetical protein LENED_000108 [Lentinula edodes]
MARIPLASRPLDFVYLCFFLNHIPASILPTFKNSILKPMYSPRYCGCANGGLLSQQTHYLRLLLEEMTPYMDNLFGLDASHGLSYHSNSQSSYLEILRLRALEK